MQFYQCIHGDSVPVTSSCRWSIMVYETKIPRQHSASTVTEDCSDDSEVKIGITADDPCCSVHPTPVLTATFSGPGSADPDVRRLCGRSPVQDPDLRPALGGNLLCQVRLTLTDYNFYMHCFCYCHNRVLVLSGFCVRR